MERQNAYCVAAPQRAGAGIYPLLSSLGLTLIYGVGRVVNFAHGALFSLGAMCAVWLVMLGLSFWVSLLLSLVIVGLAGVVMD